MPIVNYPFVSVFGSPKPVLPVMLKNPSNGFESQTWALIDTGADCTIIPGYIATELYHNITHKNVERTGCAGIGGDTISYHHTFSLNILESIGNGVVSQKTVIRMKKKTFSVVRGLNTMVLGESDFLKKYILNIDYKKKIFSVLRP